MWIFLGGGLQHFSVSPRPVESLNLLGLDWGGGAGTNGFGPRLDNKKYALVFFLLEFSE